MVRILRWVGGTFLFLVGLLFVVLLLFRSQSVAREVLSSQAAAPSTGTFVQTPNGRLFVQEMGKRTDPAVLLIHGTGAWSEIWRSTLIALSGAHYRAIAVDLPPFGFSERPKESTYDRHTQALRLLALLDALGLEKVILVGHSFGAGATVELAMIAPNRVVQLVLVDAALGLPAIESDAITKSVVAPTATKSSLTEQLLRQRPLRNLLISATATNPLLTRQLLYQLIAKRAAATDETIAMLQRQLVVKGSTDALGDWLLAFLFDEGNGLSQDSAAYATLDLPVHLLWGELDQVTPPAQGEALQQLLPRATFTLLPGVGHIPALEDPATFNPTFLAQLAKGT